MYTTKKPKNPDKNSLNNKPSSTFLVEDGLSVSYSVVLDFSVKDITHSEGVFCFDS